MHFLADISIGNIGDDDNIINPGLGLKTPNPLHLCGPHLYQNPILSQYLTNPFNNNTTTNKIQK